MGNNYIALMEADGKIEFGTKLFKVALDKNDAKVLSILNLITGEEMVNDGAMKPWFSYINKDAETLVHATNLTVDGDTLLVDYTDGTKAELLFEINEEYFTVTLTNEIGHDCIGIVVCSLAARYNWDADDPESFALSLVPMTTTAVPETYPGGFFRYVSAAIPRDLKIKSKGTKYAVCFSKMGIHREILKNIILLIDPKVGVKSTTGGPFTYDTPSQNWDYVINTGGITPENAEETAKLCEEYSVEQINYHQGLNFLQGDFNFWGSRTEEEKKNEEYIYYPPSVFKERIGDKFAPRGTYFCLHTYSALIDYRSHNLLSNPKWQQQICADKRVYTLKDELSADATEIFTAEDASDFDGSAYVMPTGNPRGNFVLVDEEIIMVKTWERDGTPECAGCETGFKKVMRGACGTKPAVHKKGAVIKQLLGWYFMFQAEPLSELYYHIARETARAYNEGGFRMIYLDGFETFYRTGLSPAASGPAKAYLHSEFVREILANCKIPPLLESSNMVHGFWGARGRWGAVDYAKTQYKRFKTNHARGQIESSRKMFYTATLGWFYTAPDMSSPMKNTSAKTMFRDDLDHMGTIGIAHNFGTVYSGFSLDSFMKPTKLADNSRYYNTYSRLRKANYFSPEVREAIKDLSKEYKVFKREDGSWAFKEMKYFKHRIFDMADNTFVTRGFKNEFGAQTPFVRIEERYSTIGEDTTTILPIGKEVDVASVAGVHSIEEMDLSGKLVIKTRVHGNGRDGAILITLKSPRYASDARNDYYIPTNFEGWREFILIDNDNGDTDGHEFEGINTAGCNAECYRQSAKMAKINSVTISTDGDMTGVMIEDVVACKHTDAPAKNPSVTIGGNTMTFMTELKAGEYVEYYPEFNKAYHNYYDFEYDEDGKYKRDTARIREIEFTGKLVLPEGDFECTYNAEAMSDAPLRAQVVIGASGEIIANPDSWKAPEVDVDKYYEVTLR